MAIQVDVTDGSITPAGSVLKANTAFEWVNNTATAVYLADCGNWCAPDKCTVPPNGGTTPATVLATPNTNSCAFKDSGWDAPGQPRITVSPVPTHREKEVA